MLPTARLRAFAVAHPTFRLLPLRPFASPVFRATSCMVRYSATTTSWGDGKPLAIAQRLPDPNTFHAPHRLREFEVRSSAVSVEIGDQTDVRFLSLTVRYTLLRVVPGDLV